MNSEIEDRIEDGGQVLELGTVTGRMHDGDPSHLRTIAPDLRALAFPIVDLQATPDNARQHGERDLAALVESLRLHGQRKPGVGKRTYRGLSNVILCGNGTLQAAQRLGWSHMAVTWFDGTDDEAREYAIRDNRTSDLSRFDSNQLAALQADGVDLLSLGWNQVELADLLRADAPVPKFEPVDAEHRLDELQPHCGTCTCREGAR